jgi:glycosyltransferase involved in cell wall biosynthesis
MSKLEARANPRVSRFSRDRKNLRLTCEKCTGRAACSSTLLAGLIAIVLTSSRSGSVVARIWSHPLAVASESGSALSAIAANFRRMRALRCCVREVQPDLVISFMTPINVIAILAARCCGVPVVACEHTDPRHQDLNSAWSALRIAVYPFADAVTFLTANVWRRWRSWLGRKARLMPNPVTIDMAGAPAALHYSRILIAAGRLVQLKGFDMLIEAFSAIAARDADWGLTILGEGNISKVPTETVRAHALNVQRSMGYRPFCSSARVVQSKNASATATVRIENRGVAPPYYSWPVEVEALGSAGKVTGEGRAVWPLATLLPGKSVEWSITFNSTPNRTKAVVLRLTNPMPGGHVITFANAEMGSVKAGWLTLIRGAI